MTSGIAGELLQKHQNSAQPSSQTLCAVLRATLEVLQAEGLDATPSALFAAVMSSLERPQGYSTPEVGIFAEILLARTAASNSGHRHPQNS